MDVSLLKLRFVLQLDVVRPARVATMAGSDRSHRFQGRDPEETLPQAGVEMVRLVTAGGGCQARDYGGRGEEGVSDARPGSAGRRSRGRQGRVIMRVFCVVRCHSVGTNDGERSDPLVVQLSRPRLWMQDRAARLGTMGQAAILDLMV